MYKINYSIINFSNLLIYLTYRLELYIKILPQNRYLVYNYSYLFKQDRYLFYNNIFVSLFYKEIY